MTYRQIYTDNLMKGLVLGVLTGRVIDIAHSVPNPVRAVIPRFARFSTLFD